MDSSAVSARLIGMMFVEKGLITEEQLELALDQQRATGDRLGEILVEQFGVERLDLAGALAEQWAEYEHGGTIEERASHGEHRDLLAVSDEWRGSDHPDASGADTDEGTGKRPIGEIFVERGLISAKQLEEALEEQKESGRRLGEILVATGRLSRLELASALADQWASFQKLRPPGADTPGETRIMPTREAAVPSPSAAASAELTRRIEELAARIDVLAEGDGVEDRKLEQTAEALRERIDQLERSLPTGEPEAVHELRSQLADVAARIDAIPAPDVAWRSDLAEVAENLRTRVERVEQGLEGAPRTAEIADLRGSLDELAARIDSLPAPSEEWREPVAELHASAVALAERADVTQVETEEWRGKLTSLREQLEQLASSGDAGIAELRVSLEVLAAHVHALPGPSEEWREPLAELAARLDALPRGEWRAELAEVAENLRTRLERIEQSPVPDDAGMGELRGALEVLAARVESLPAPSEEWRVELGEVAENLRTRIERVEQGLEGASGVAEIAELRSWVEALRERADAFQAPSEEWSEEIASLRAWVEQLASSDGSDIVALRGALEALAARVESLPTPSEEWREPLVDLAARLDALPKGEWRLELGEVAENLRTRIERVEQGLEAASGSAEIAELRSWVEALRERADAIQAPSEEWREEIASLRAWVEQLALSDGSDIAALRGALESLAARVESLQVPSEDWREPLADLAAQLDALPTTSEEWRDAVSTLAARLDVLSANDARAELADAAEALSKRIERIEEGMVGQARAAAVAEIAEHVAEMARKVEGLPASSDEWREQLAALTARLDSMPASAEWRDELAELTARVDAIRTDEWRSELGQVAENLRARIERVEQESGGAHTVELDELRLDIGALATRMDAMPVPFDTIRVEVAELADALHLRVAEVEHQLSSEPDTEALDGLRSELGALAARVDAIPAPLDAFRAELADVAQALHNRVEHVELRLPTALGTDSLDGLRSELSALAARIEEIPAPLDAFRADLADLAQVLQSRIEHVELRLSTAPGSESLDEVTARMNQLASKIDEGAGAELRLRESLSALADARAEGTKADVDDVRDRIEDVTSKLERAMAVAGRIDEVERRLDEATSPVAAFGSQLDELKQTADWSAHRTEELGHRMDELASRRDAAEVEQVLAQRIAVAEETLAGLHTGLAAVPPLVEERLAAADERAGAAAGQAAAAIESLRRELGELRDGVEAARDSATERVDAVASALRDDLEAAAERVAGGAVDELRFVVDAHGARLESLAADLSSAEQKGAGRLADLSAVRARLETVESALAGAGDWSEAVDGATARIESLEVSLIESFATEAVERDAQIQGLRAEVSECTGALEKAQVKRKDIRELRDAVERVERRVDERTTEDAAVVQATEAAVRDGIASLGERLSASGDAYLETSRELSRSLAGLGLALEAADAHRLDAPRSTDRPTEISVFLAFAPTAEGYRLVECEGSAPVLGDEVAIEDCEGPLVVTRLGASPLPFDPRPCVYLDRA